MSARDPVLAAHIDAVVRDCNMSRPDAIKWLLVTRTTSDRVIAWIEADWTSDQAATVIAASPSRAAGFTWLDQATPQAAIDAVEKRYVQAGISPAELTNHAQDRAALDLIVALLNAGPADDDAQATVTAANKE